MTSPVPCFSGWLRVSWLAPGHLPWLSPSPPQGFRMVLSKNNLLLWAIFLASEDESVCHACSYLAWKKIFPGTPPVAGMSSPIFPAPLTKLGVNYFKEAKVLLCVPVRRISQTHSAPLHPQISHREKKSRRGKERAVAWGQDTPFHRGFQHVGDF